MFHYVDVNRGPYRRFRINFCLEGEQTLLLGCVGKSTPGLVTLPSVVLQHYQHLLSLQTPSSAHMPFLSEYCPRGAGENPIVAFAVELQGFCESFELKRRKVGSLASALCRMGWANTEQ